MLFLTKKCIKRFTIYFNGAGRDVVLVLDCSSNGLLNKILSFFKPIIYFVIYC